ncbi:hypothetical protein JCM15519_08890 [Fundidesulfovibrio butyratiphilus]
MKELLSRFSIRETIVIMVFLAMLPALGVIVYTGNTLHRHVLEGIRREALFSVSELAQAQERATQGVRQTLAVLANTPELRALNAQAASELFATVMRLNTLYANIVLTNAKGDVIGSGAPYPKANLSERKSIRDALSRRGFATGEYILGKDNKLRALSFSQAVLDGEGRPVGVITLAMGLDRYAELFDLASLPGGSELFVVDHKGADLLSRGESSPQDSPRLPPDLFTAISSTSQSGVFEHTGSDGAPRLFVYNQVRLTPTEAPYVFICVGIPSQVAQRAGREVLVQGATLLAGSAAFVLVLAWIFAGFTVGGQVGHLLSVTGRLSRGELSARTGLESSRGEIGRLGSAIDEMATSLEEDALVRDANEERLRLYQAVFDNAVEGITVTNAEGVIERVNPGFSLITGYSADEVVGQNPRILKSERHDATFYAKMWEDITQRGKWAGEIWNRRKSGEAYPEWLSVSAIRDAKGEVSHYVGVFHDITELKEQQQTIEFLANHDPLTGLPNRLLFEDRLAMALAQMQRRGTRLALLYLDLDNFKNVNDSLGHAVGDMLLHETADRLTKAVREMDTVYRQGGDEFIVILPELSGPEEAMLVAGRILDAVAKPCRLQGYEVVSTASVGVALSPEDGTQPGELLKKADLAMYRAKHGGGNTVQFFAPGMDVLATRRLFLESELRRAMERDEFELHYQPVVDLGTGRLTGAEALLRWRRGSDIVGPDEFIPVAEETGLVIQIGAWVLAEACRQMRDWGRAGLPPLNISVNISGKQFRQHNFEEMVKGVFSVYEVDPTRIYLEVTESSLIANLAASASKLSRLRELGVKVLLDDFGTGYSSLAYLKRLPVDGLKIDRSFVREIPNDPDSLGIVAAILALSRVLGLSVVAEGVETQEQLEYLTSQGCARMQGYLASYPLPAESFQKLLEADTPFFEPTVSPEDAKNSETSLPKPPDPK